MSESVHLSDRERIFQAAELNNQKIIEYMVNEKRWPVNITDFRGRTPGHIAAMYGHVNIVKFVVEKDSSILKSKDRTEETMLMKAITFGHFGVVKYLVDNWNLSISERYSHRHFGNTAIHLASRYGKLDILKYLVEEKNGNVNVENNFRETPLFLAAENKLYRIIQYLVEERNADVKKVNSKGYNILFIAVDNDDLGFMKYLLDLRKIPVDLNWRGFSGETLVHRAVDLNRENMLLYLVNEKHADVNIADESGDTPLHKAAAKDNYRVCRFLIEHGANTELENEKGLLPAQLSTNERLSRYMKDYAPEVRSRRSVRELTSYHSEALSSLGPLGWISADSNHVAVAGKTEVNVPDSFQFLGFLIAAKTILKSRKHTLDARVERVRFSSPREIILNNMDHRAIDAIQRFQFRY